MKDNPCILKSPTPFFTCGWTLFSPFFWGNELDGGSLKHGIHQWLHQKMHQISAKRKYKIEGMTALCPLCKTAFNSTHQKLVVLNSIWYCLGQIYIRCGDFANKKHAILSSLGHQTLIIILLLLLITIKMPVEYYQQNLVFLNKYLLDSILKMKNQFSFFGFLITNQSNIMFLVQDKIFQKKKKILK